MRTRSNSIVRLDWYHHLVTRTILDFQDPVTGLLPPRIKWNSEDHFSGKHPKHAWVRDNVYSILAVWALALAYRKNADMDEDRAKAYELTQAVVKLMRGLLSCMMRQADKVESFKTTQGRNDSLHAKYDMTTGETCVSDHDWGHLQIDATSLYLLMLAQMTASGIQIIFTVDEVAFIQNLVFYIEKAHSIPDYGIWERGDKLNHGMPELNASSIGMAKAALESLNGLDLFGPEGSQASVIHVLPDDIQKCKAVLQSMLPRESNSKETAASLLSVISFPAFAIEDKDIVDLTRDEIIDKLQGKYGLCRFLRDGYKTPVEDPFRLHYEPAELEIFQHLECEWPLFYTYLILDGLYLDRPEQSKKYSALLDELLFKDESGLILVPELYYVPKDKVAEEKANPHSVERTRGEFAPHMWSQSLYIVASLLQEKFIALGELDPLNRRHSTENRPDVVVQVALLAEDEAIRELLVELEVPVQLIREVQPIQILPAHVLGQIYQQLGKCSQLNMKGRTVYNIGALASSTLYRVGNGLFVFTPQFLDYHQFYLCLDNEFLVDRLKSLVGYLGANWRLLGRPTLTLIITNSMMEELSTTSCMAKLIVRLQGGYLSGVRVRLGYLQDFMSTSCITTLHFARDYREIDIKSLQRNPSMSKDFLRRSQSRDRTRSFNSSTPEGPRFSDVSGSIKRSRSISIYCDKDNMVMGAPSRRSVAEILKNGAHLYSWSTTSKNSDTEHMCSPAKKETFEERVANGWSPARSRTMSLDLESKQYIQKLEEAVNINDQADILHFLYNTKGPDFDTNLFGDRGATVQKLLLELYEKACEVKLWSLVRHTAGLLHKEVEDLADCCTDLLVHQKQITIGIPQDGQEEVITRPLPSTDLKNLIYKVFGEDMSTGVLTQELLVYLAIFVKSDPKLFSEMLRLRVGLIIEVMVAELARSLDCTGEDAAEYFMNLSPFEMKTLLYHILSGKEFGISDGSVRNISEKQLSIINIDLPKRVGMRKLSDAIKTLSGGRRGLTRQFEKTDLQPLAPQETEEPKGPEQHEVETHHDGDRVGNWVRRRCLDGALNRVPEAFYPNVWKVLEKCHWITIYKHALPSAMVREMTAREIKFALCVEGALNRIPEPEYRQLIVEAMMVLALVVESYPNQPLWDTVDVDDLVYEGYQIYLREQAAIHGDSTVCCARPPHERISCGGAGGICRYFYDTAPSGRYGTMTYFSKAVAKKLSQLPHQNECVLS
ncbi:phosphorylase b kinase regulatory subunit alpha, liver isoform-like isoform X2 [Actinia tenebrosa]|uniref:Phosphorylase b kinase regulatory subunit n=1 Tax=Actinia tenebrosa TaxID=6105 RepID=A0A6P8H6D0_ACTTE|nr:phosphorylase b kinase regulatory subunit alpha, liver isoform-like isoform X2 [Actinia tenebrosa]